MHVAKMTPFSIDCDGAGYLEMSLRPMRYSTTSGWEGGTRRYTAPPDHAHGFNRAGPSTKLAPPAQFQAHNRNAGHHVAVSRCLASSRPARRPARGLALTTTRSSAGMALRDGRLDPHGRVSGCARHSRQIDGLGPQRRTWLQLLDTARPRAQRTRTDRPDPESKRT
jgi:hypothetical protein